MTPQNRNWIATYDPDDPELHAAIEQSYKRFAWLFIPVFGVTFAFAQSGLGWIENHGSTAYDRFLAATPDWAAYTVLAIALAILVAAYVFGLRPAARTAIRTNPRMVLTRAQARRVNRQIQGRLPVAPHEVAFLRAVARGMRAQRWLVGAMGGMALLALAAGMLGAAVLGWLVVVPVLVAGFGLRADRQARRFLESVGTTPV
jgi:hypothetical protein